MINSMNGAFSLAGKNAIVTGGNRGIGLGIAEAFAQQGANVAICCRDEEKANQVIADFRQKYAGKFEFYRLDVMSREDCKDVSLAVAGDFGGIDILVNNSGIKTSGALLEMDESLESWETCIDVDLNGVFRMCYFAGKIMRDAGKGGRIINITSNAGDTVNKPNTMGAYSAAKAGANWLTKNLAYELAEYGIRVNAIAPGYTMTRVLDESAPLPQTLSAVLPKIPVGRFGKPIEIGALAVYLASDASDLMTGAVLTIDGGYSLAT